MPPGILSRLVIPLICSIAVASCASLADHTEPESEAHLRETLQDAAHTREDAVAAPPRADAKEQVAQAERAPAPEAPEAAPTTQRELADALAAANARAAAAHADAERAHAAAAAARRELEDATAAADARVAAAQAEADRAHAAADAARQELAEALAAADARVAAARAEAERAQETASSSAEHTDAAEPDEAAESVREPEPAAAEPEPTPLPYARFLTTRPFAADGTVDFNRHPAYGLLAFPARATESSQQRYLDICHGFVSSQVAEGAAAVASQMVTMWPTAYRYASSLNARSLEGDDTSALCRDAVRNIDLGFSLKAIARAAEIEKQHEEETINLDGRGPFLFAWSPRCPSCLLFLNLSSVSDGREAARTFELWRSQIERAPESWGDIQSFGITVRQLAILLVSEVGKVIPVKAVANAAIRGFL